MSVASEYTEDGGNEQLTLQQPAAAGSLPKYTVTFDREAKLGMLLERRAAFAPGATAEQKKARPEQTVVTMVIEGGAAAQKGVAVGSRLLLINGQDATALPYAKCLELVKSLPRPLHLVFEKSMAACDAAKGWVLVRKSAGAGPPSSMAGWQRMFFVVGGAVAKRHVLQLYSSKAQYEDIVVRMFQGQPLTGMKYKAYALSGTFKCSAIQSKAVHKSTVATPLLNDGLHAVDATPARWRGGAVSLRSIQPARPRSRRDSLIDLCTGPRCTRASTSRSSTSRCGTPTRGRRR